MLSLIALIAAGLFVIWFMLCSRPKKTSSKQRPVTRVKATIQAISDDESSDGTPILTLTLLSNLPTRKSLARHVLIGLV